MTRKPEILAPAGDTQSFLAAMAAGADAVYLGLKHFSARMQAETPAGKGVGTASCKELISALSRTGRKKITTFFGSTAAITAEENKNKAKNRTAFLYFANITFHRRQPLTQPFRNAVI